MKLVRFFFISPFCFANMVYGLTVISRFVFEKRNCVLFSNCTGRGEAIVSDSQTFYSGHFVGTSFDKVYSKTFKCTRMRT